MISTLFFLHSFANDLEMGRILINSFLLLYLFEGGAPTFIKAEKFWPNICAAELQTSRKYYHIQRPSVDVRSQYFRDIHNQHTKRFRGVKCMKKSSEYITTLFLSLSQTNTITGFVVFSDVWGRFSVWYSRKFPYMSKRWHDVSGKIL